MIEQYHLNPKTPSSSYDICIELSYITHLDHVHNITTKWNKACITNVYNSHIIGLHTL